MKIQRFGIALTVVNALLLAVVLTQYDRPALEGRSFTALFKSG